MSVPVSCHVEPFHCRVLAMMSMLESTGPSIWDLGNLGIEAVDVGPLVVEVTLGNVGKAVVDALVLGTGKHQLPIMCKHPPRAKATIEKNETSIATETQARTHIMTVHLDFPEMPSASSVLRWLRVARQALGLMVWMPSCMPKSKSTAVAVAAMATAGPAAARSFGFSSAPAAESELFRKKPWRTISAAAAAAAAAA
eukprot:CAMPEP_0172839488 /NCGR_PEP_ID=MMETSP1075-20121228/28590_1 /TAXON_ID=2916 /ORGANISM="Ceratium fusus, Strain PA161109" /LENGTH=196 /DNA_ID=CAMNT_0013683145 /DNA_START=860 /DNA_END=1448 /DNA_ORIENTATION=+